MKKKCLFTLVFAMLFITSVSAVWAEEQSPTIQPSLPTSTDGQAYENFLEGFGDPNTTGGFVAGFSLVAYKADDPCFSFGEGDVQGDGAWLFLVQPGAASSQARSTASSGGQAGGQITSLEWSGGSKQYTTALTELDDKNFAIGAERTGGDYIGDLSGNGQTISGSGVTESVGKTEVQVTQSPAGDPISVGTSADVTGQSLAMTNFNGSGVSVNGAGAILAQNALTGPSFSALSFVGANAEFAGSGQNSIAGGVDLSGATNITTGQNSLSTAGHIRSESWINPCGSGPCR